MSLKTGHSFVIPCRLTAPARASVSYLLVSLFLLQHFFIVSPMVSQASPAALRVLASTTIVISEVDGDTPLAGTDTANEWFELRNISNASITLSGWTISDNGATDTIPTVTLGAGGHVIVAGTTAGFASEHPNFTGTVLAISDGSIGTGLNNSGDALTLKDNNGVAIDALSWGGNTSVFNPAAGNDNSSNTNQRNAAGTDSDTAGDWTLAAETPNGNTNGGASSNNPSGTGLANPATVAAGNSSLLTVQVTPGANPTSTNLAVTADLTLIGGSATQTFFDDGTNGGDVTANDNIFSYLATVGANVTPGAKNLTATIADGQSRFGTASIALTVSHPPVPTQTLPFSQNWSNTGLIVNNDDWTSVPGIIGYRGDNLTTSVGGNPQTVLTDGVTTPVSVLANQTDPNSAATGVAEFELANPTIALKGSSTADAPHIVFNLDTTGQSNIAVFYNLRDLDASTNNSVQPVALQYRVGNTGNYTNIPAGLVADASFGPSIAGHVSSVAAALPAAAENQPLVQIRIITVNANGNDEWIGVDNINITSNGTLPITARGSALQNQLAPGSSTLLTVTVNPATNPVSTSVSVTGDLSSIGGNAAQTFFDNGTNGDVTANDNVFSYLTTIPANAPVGIRALPISIADAQNRTSLTSISLIVFNPQAVQEHLVMGNPTNATIDVNQLTNYLLLSPQFSMSYHRDRGIPNWVSWHLDSTWATGFADRQNDFRPDPLLPTGWYQATQFDYIGSGFDRGHHAPSADRTRSVEDNSATFLMTNMMPQAPNNNQGAWEDLESYARTLLGQSELYIVMGGTGQGGTGSNGGITQTIAGGKITVPAFTWKVILVLPIGESDVSRVDANTRTIAVIMPNDNSMNINSTWQPYVVSVDQVEALTGYNFFSNVPAQIQNVIEARIDGSNCSFSINPTSANAPSSGNTGSVAVTAGAGCGWTATTNDNWISISGAATGTGDGTLNYSVTANNGGARTGTLTIGGQTFTITQAAAASYSIAGSVSYGITAGQQNPVMVPDVVITMTASGTPVASDTTDSAGAYLLENLTPGGNYIVTPTKSDDINGISPSDATMILRHIAANGTGPNALNANQRIAADTSGDGNITPFDATLILRFIATGTSNANTGQVGKWKFDPVSRPYEPLNNSVSGHNYTAFLIGEINGSWTP